MIIDQFYVKGFPVPEVENNPPVGLDRDALVTFQIAFQIAFQRVQAVAVQPQIINALCYVKTCKNRSYPDKHIGRQQPGITTRIVPFQPAISEAANHNSIPSVN